MKADFALDLTRYGWRRMTFVDAGGGVGGTLRGGGGKKLASYELQKASGGYDDTACPLFSFVVCIVDVFLWSTRGSVVVGD